jgi:3-hydroxy-9,10-secoandrosta-1,3,5(10)-triene-9,17-dione monooxygenase
MLNAPCPNHPEAVNTPRFLLLIAAHEVQKLNSWDSCGMAATGSHDVLTDQLLVPPERVFALHDIFAQRPGARGTDYIDRLPLVPYLTTSIIGPLLGCAEGAYDAYVEALRGMPLVDSRSAELVARCAAQLHNARLLYDSVIALLHDAGVRDHPLEAGQLLLLKRDRAYMAQQCVQVVRRLVERLSATSLVGADPVQRHWRDIQAMAAHRDVGWSDAMLAYGEAIVRPASTHVPPA